MKSKIRSPANGTIIVSPLCRGIWVSGRCSIVGRPLVRLAISLWFSSVLGFFFSITRISCLMKCPKAVKDVILCYNFAGPRWTTMRFLRGNHGSFFWVLGGWRYWHYNCRTCRMHLVAEFQACIAVSFSLNFTDSKRRILGFVIEVCVTFATYSCTCSIIQHTHPWSQWFSGETVDSGCYRGYVYNRCIKLLIVQSWSLVHQQCAIVVPLTSKEFFNEDALFSILY